MMTRASFSRVAASMGFPGLVLRLVAHSGRVPILMYHSIVGERPGGALRSCLDLMGMQVSVATFERHMEVLSRQCNVISLSEHLATRGRRHSTEQGGTGAPAG